jgi:hypothetical protein
MARGKADDPFNDDDWGPNDAQEDSGEMPESSADSTRSEFLKPHHVGSARVGTLELLSVTGATEYSDVVLHVKLGSRTYRMGLKTFDPGYVALLKKFGKKKSDWKGTLRYKVMPHRGRPDGFIAVRPS